MGRFFNFCSENKKFIVVAIAIILVIVLLCVFGLNLDSWLLKNFHSLKNADIYDDMRAVTIGDTEYLPKDMSTYLIMGIDKNTKIDEQTNNTEQADFILFIVCDHAKKTYTTLQINRDTITDVKILSQWSGSYLGTDKWQITLAHTYGLDESARALNTIDAFKSLMNNVPVTQYISFTMPVVNTITDAVKGLSVTITADAANATLGYNEGDTIDLDKTNALDFVREREDNIGRMARQRLFMDALLEKLKSESIDYTDYLKDLADYIGTNVSDTEFENINKYIKNYTFNGIKTLDGTSGTKKVAGVDYATFEASEASINDFLINYCYDVRKK